MLNGMGPWIFSAVVFIGIMILLIKLLAMIGRFFHNVTDVLNNMQNIIMQNTTAIQGFMMMQQGRQMNADKER